MAKILIIEDDATLQSAYETVLKIEGHEVSVAADGLDGLDRVQKQQPEIILLDMLLPRMNGLEFLRAYNLASSDKKTKIIVFSNMSVPSDVKAAMKLGATKYLTKSSFTPKEIADIIKEVIGE
jgi:CheY-like chemotaxis protein